MIFNNQYVTFFLDSDEAIRLTERLVYADIAKSSEIVSEFYQANIDIAETHPRLFHKILWYVLWQSGKIEGIRQERYKRRCPKSLRRKIK